MENVKPVSQQEIADHLGVSRMTVARALGGHPKVSEKRRQEILGVARALGYDQYSNREAKFLAAKRLGRTALTGTAGYLVPQAEDEDLPYYQDLLRGLTKGAREVGLDLMLLDRVPNASWSRVDGILAMGRAFNPVPDGIYSSIKRVSLVVELEAAPSVIADEALGIGLAVKHLVDLGHLRIAYLVSTSAPSSVETARLNAYREALLANDIVPREGWVHDMRDMGGMLERGRFGMDAWLRDGFLQQGCTALMVQNDRAALGAMDVLVAAGIRVPDDLSVIGFDSTSECEVMRPRLTSVRIPLETIGSNAVHILTRTLRDEPVPAKTVFPATLDVRDSTGAPRATNHRTPF